MFLAFIVVIFLEGLTSVFVFTLPHYQNRAKNLGEASGLAQIIILQ